MHVDKRELAGVSLSGGMDSFTLLHRVQRLDELTPLALTFNYGQRHVREIDAARSVCQQLGVTHKVMDLRAVLPLLAGPSLTDDIAIPEGLYADDNPGTLLTYLRFERADQGGDVVATVVNYGGEDKAGVRFGVPREGRWEVVLDTSGYDEHSSPSTAYSGSSAGLAVKNSGIRKIVPVPSYRVKTVKPTIDDRMQGMIASNSKSSLR